MKKLLHLISVIMLYPYQCLIANPVETIIADNCEVESHVITEMTPSTRYPEHMDQSLILYFRDLSLYHEGAGEKTRVCLTSAILRVRAGTQFRSGNAVVSGVYHIPKPATGSIEFEYSVPTISRDSGTFFRQISGQKDFQIQTSGESDEYTYCSSADQVISLDSRTRLTSVHPLAMSSFIDLDEQQKTYATRWNWQWKPCSVWFENREFTSVYRANNGRHYQAFLRFSADTGSYDSSAGFQGLFSHVHFHDGGKSVTGVWEASGKSGPFRFDMTDTATGRFDGTWGNSGDENSRYRWWGQFSP